MKRFLVLVISFLVFGLFSLFAAPKTWANYDIVNGSCQFSASFFTYTSLSDCEAALALQIGATTTPAADQAVAPESCEGEEVCISPEPELINGNTPSVEIKFFNLEPGKSWHICSKEKCTLAKDTTDDVASDGTLTLTVCAANSDTLRVDDCDDKDYFHEGKIYRLTLYEDEDQELRGPSVAFLVNHVYPNVKVSTPGTPLEVEVSLPGLRRPADNKNRNNYQIVVEGKDKYENKYKDDRCITMGSNGTLTAKFGRVDNKETPALNAGSYLIKVNEQINEGGVRSITDKCSGGFTFWHVNVNIDDKGKIIGGDSICLAAGVTSESCKKDPNSSDLEAYNKLLEVLNKTPVLNFGCDKDGTTKSVNGTYQCVSVNTAFGPIPTEPIAFIERLFEIILAFAGIAALGLLIFGGYKYMISRGDPEMIKSARETITSAVIGLLFIIFSFVILQMIAGDILKIPGFGGPSDSSTGIDRVDDGTIPGTELPPTTP